MSVPAVSNIRPKFFYEPANNAFEPFPYAVAFDRVVAFLGVKEIGKMSAVCQLWLNRADLHGWEKLFAVYGIPQVVGGQRDYKADFKWLYPITVSGHKIGKYFGMVVGSVPSIKQEELDKFKGRDFRVVVVPMMITRRIDQKMTHLGLDEEGNIVSPPLVLDSGYPIQSSPVSCKTVKEGDLKIAFSLKNLMVLSNLKENKNGPVFADSSWAEAVDQCDCVAPKNYVYLMEYNVAEESEGFPFESQEAPVKKDGFQVTPLMPRVLFDSVEILESGTFPDRYTPSVKFSDIVLPDVLNGGIYHAIIDTDDKKLRIDYDSYEDGDDDVVVRGWHCGSSK